MYISILTIINPATIVQCTTHMYVCTYALSFTHHTHTHLHTPHTPHTPHTVGLGPTWHRYFCQFHKEETGPRGKTRQMKYTPVGHHGSVSYRIIILGSYSSWNFHEYNNLFAGYVKIRPLRSKIGNAANFAMKGFTRKGFLVYRRVLSSGVSL